MIETGLFLVKPDGLLLGELEEAWQRIKDKGLAIKEERKVSFTLTSVMEFYREKQDGLSQYWVGYLVGRSSVAIVVEGEEANRELTRIKREIRNMFGHDWFYTGTHASDNEVEAKRQINILFQSGQSTS